MTNPYKMIDSGSKVNELHFLRNIFACPLKVGVYVDQCYDGAGLNDVYGTADRNCADNAHCKNQHHPH